VSHDNAALTPRARARLGRFVVLEGHTVSQAAKRFEVSYRTAKRWANGLLTPGLGLQDFEHEDGWFLAPRVALHLDVTCMWSGCRAKGSRCHCPEPRAGSSVTTGHGARC
jgi:hypothetical protein